MNSAGEMPYMLRRDPSELIRFINNMRRRPAYRCVCGAEWTGLYKPVWRYKLYEARAETDKESVSAKIPGR